MSLRAAPVIPREIEVIVFRDRETVGFWAHIVQLPGCFVTGPSIEELKESLQDTVHAFLRSRDIEEALWSDRVDEILRYGVDADGSLIPIETG